MLISKIGVVFNGTCDINESIEILWNDGTVYKLCKETCKSTRSAAGHFNKSYSFAVNQAIFYHDALAIDYAGKLTLSRIGSTVYITPIGTNLDMLWSTTALNVSFVYDPPETIDIKDLSEALVRSPKRVITTGIRFSSVDYTIKSFEGDPNTFAAKPVTYNKMKNKLTTEQANVYVDIHNIAREGLKADIIDYRLADVSNSSLLSPNESKWLYVKEQRKFVDVNVETATNRLVFVLDGYQNANQEQIIPNVLQGESKRRVTGPGRPYAIGFEDRKIIDRRSIDRIYFKALNLESAKYYLKSDPDTKYVISYSDFNATPNSNSYIQSIKVNNNICPVGDKLIYEFSYRSFTNILTYEFQEVCKYSVYDLIFKNKYGVLETISLNKKLSKMINIESKDFLRSIVDVEGSVDITLHTNKQFNTQGYEEWTLNTDFVPEYMNERFIQAGMSQEMWLSDQSGNIIPVLRNYDTIKPLTKLNDKLIQYTINLKLSHAKINNIQ